MLVEQISRTLHPLERTVLALLPSVTQFSEIVRKSKLKDVEVMRALEWMENKKLVSVQRSAKKHIVLGENGKLYREKGLPERRILYAITQKSLTLTQLQTAAGVTSEEINVSLGTLRRLKAISIIKDNETSIAITSEGKHIKETPEERFLLKKFPALLGDLKQDDMYAFEQLQHRKDIINLKDDNEWAVALTDLGRKLIASGVEQKDQIGRLTPRLLQSGDWMNKEFRPYDTSVGASLLHSGKKHPVTQAIDYIKKIWLEMGFKEMSGRMVHTAFWDLDALFVPQDHPARDMQDTFYLARPNQGTLPALAKKIKETHEKGGTTSSRGWGFGWSEAEARKLLLRTHTTVLSAQTLAALKESDLPVKFFAVGKVFRNETLDYSHLFEFFQVEGIVVDPNANLKHLKGYLRELYKKMGYSQVRIRPAHFPYTEPSCEVEVFHPVKKKWIELGGAGIFRPEVVVPLLGKDVPVLAWGLGLDRIISAYYQITDIRDLYRNDIKQLREGKLWVR